MADGRYRVTSGCDGARYLHLFGPDGKNRSIVLDTGETEELEAVVGYADGTAMWSVDAFESLLDELGAAQQASTEQEKKG